jgi:sterol desaturase/sphingolipid hydroxylase (fatty acid hydroxylase superfamily)
MSLRNPSRDRELPHQLVCLTCRGMVLLIVASLGAMLVAFASGHDGWGLIAAATGVTALVLASGIVSGADFYDRHHHRTPHSA